MNQLIHLIGLALPDTPTIFRLKVSLFGGIGGLGHCAMRCTSTCLSRVSASGRISRRRSLRVAVSSTSRLHHRTGRSPTAGNRVCICAWPDGASQRLGDGAV
jgi:hypothetical protein